MTGLVKAVVTMSSKIQPAPPQEYVLTEREVGLAPQTLLATVDETVLPPSRHSPTDQDGPEAAELQQNGMTSPLQGYKKQVLTATQALTFLTRRD